MSNVATGSIQKAILEFLKEALEEVADISVAVLLSGMSSLALYKNLNALKRERAMRQVRRSLRHLRQRKLIEMKIRSGEPRVRLLPLSKEWQERFELEKLALGRLPKWDGKWRIVVFDIPERQGRARRALSHKMEKIGAVRLQDSVFVYPFPWRDEVEFVSEIFGVNPYVRYIEAVSIDGAEKLRKCFDLSQDQGRFRF